MVTWSVLIFDSVVLATVVLFSLVCASHIISGWLLRKHFEMAIRSPLLLTMSGSAGICLFSSVVFRLLLIDLKGPDTANILLIPLNVTFNTSAYVMRGVRLLVMYNPSLRKRYGPYIKEVAMVKALMISFGVLEALVWSLSLVFGVKRVASFTMLVVLLDALLTLGGTLALMVKLRMANDLFDMSVEIQSVGACLLGYLALVVTHIMLPVSLEGYVQLTAMFVRYFATMWISNIQSVRALLGRRVGGVKNVVPWFPYVPWRSPSSRIVVGAGRSTLSRATTFKSSGRDGWLDSIMGFPPLLRAFKEYCRTALCSESLLFLIEISEFGDLLETAPADNDKTVLFERFQAAVENYVKDGAPFEINICSKAKAAVLQVADIESFRLLTPEGISQVLAPAAKEVCGMLKDNVYDKFRKTEEYKQIAGSLEGTAQNS